MVVTELGPLPTWCVPMSSRRKRSRYFSQRLNNHHISRGLVPRIREYLSVNGSSVVDVEKMAVDLQAQHREYSRKKRAVFQQLVGEVYRDYKTELGVTDINQRSQSAREGGEGEGEEGQLIQREMEHSKRMNTESTDQLQGGTENAESAEMELPSDEFQTPNFNILNNSLIQIYKTDNGQADQPITDNHVSSPPSATIAPGTNGPMEVEKEGSGATPSLPELPSGHGKHNESEGDALVPSDNVEPHPKPHPDPSNQSLETPNNTLSSSTEPIIPIPSVSKATTGECAESAPVDLARKKVSFSSPEVTSQVDYTVGEESNMRPVVKRKKSRRHESENPQAKRKKEDRQETAVASSQLKPTKSSEFVVQSSSVRFSDVGGCSDCLREISKLLLHMRQPELFARLGVRPPQGFLLHGPPGCGKTLIANAIAGELGLPFIKLAATEIVSGVSGESEGTLRDLFQLAKDHAPCILFIDEVDAICPKRETAQREMEKRIVTQLLACLDDLNGSMGVGHVLVIGATSRPDSLDPALRRAGRFDREISIGIPDLQARLSILKVLCRGLCLEDGFNFSLVAEKSPGFVGADLSSLVTEAALCAVNRVLSAHSQGGKSQPELAKDGVVCEDSYGMVKGEGVRRLEASSSLQTEEDLPLLTQQQLEATFISTADFLLALESVQPSAQREGFATVPNTSWEDVGALEGIREELSMAILAPVRYPQQFASLGLSSPPGVLLAGPPGCGKTLLAKAIANESGINFISVKGPELLNMYVGESERAVRQVFQRARNSSPCVIFFDELDALCPKRSEMAETSASARVVNQLLTEMDGLEARRQVFIMAATNRPDIIDPAVLRPGRLDKILYVGLPSPSERAAILLTITKGGSRPRLDPDVDLQLLSSDDYCKGFSGADLSSLVREASIDALKEHMSLNPLHLAATSSSSSSSQLPASPAPAACPQSECVVCMRHFTSALKKIHPSVSVKDQAFYGEMSLRFRSSSAVSSLPSGSTD